MFGIGFQELLLILLIVLILFGAKKVPELARSLGKALSEFRKAAKDIELDDTKTDHTKSADTLSGDDKLEEPPYKA